MGMSTRAWGSPERSDINHIPGGKARRILTLKYLIVFISTGFKMNFKYLLRLQNTEVEESTQGRKYI
jgi:hypothetical protein